MKAKNRSRSCRPGTDNDPPEFVELETLVAEKYSAAINDTVDEIEILDTSSAKRRYLLSVRRGSTHTTAVVGVRIKNGYIRASIWMTLIGGIVCAATLIQRWFY